MTICGSLPLFPALALFASFFTLSSQCHQYAHVYNDFVGMLLQLGCFYETFGWWLPVLLHIYKTGFLIELYVVSHPIHFVCDVSHMFHMCGGVKQDIRRLFIGLQMQLLEDSLLMCMIKLYICFGDVEVNAKTLMEWKVLKV